MLMHLMRALASFVWFASFTMASPAAVESLEVPVMEHAGGGDLDTCALGAVSGLKAGGDGFLAVRTGPASSYRKVDEIHNGDKVWLFDQKGKWIGIVYGVNLVECSPIKSSRPVRHKGKKGWVHENWVKIITG